MTTICSYSVTDSGEDIRRMCRKAHRRRLLRVTTACASLLLLGAALAFWVAPIFTGGAR